MKTFNLPVRKIERHWFVADATRQTLGRFATKIACYLRGKHKPEYSPYMDVGDYIIVLNAKNILVSGNKSRDKIYYHHTGYVGGIKSINFSKLMNDHPTRAIEYAVKGMLPKNSLGRSMYRKLKVYPGEEHSHEAQCPVILKFD